MNENPYAAPEQTVPEVRRSWWLAWVAVFGLVALVVVGLLLPATRSARGAARRVGCSNNLRQIALALHNYAQEHGRLPPARTFAADGTPLHSWRTLILPYLEEQRLYESIDLEKPWDDPANAKAREAVVSAFMCPANLQDPPLTTYQVVPMSTGLFRPDGSATADELAAADPATIFVIDVPSDRAVHWMEPRDLDTDAFFADALHSSGHGGHLLLTATADGHVATFVADAEHVTAADRRALLTTAKDGPDDRDR